MAVAVQKAPHRGPDFIIENVGIEDLLLDAKYQRDLSEPDVDRIVFNYRNELFAPLCVGMRKNGDLYVVDGQHELLAARQLGWKNVPCRIFDSRGSEHEAEVFESLQTQRRPLTVAARWKARLARKEKDAVAITKILDGLGLELTSWPGPTNLQCFVACEKGYARGTLRDALVVIVQAWDFNLLGFRAAFVNGISLILAAMRSDGIEVDMKRMVTALSKISPSNFLRDMGSQRHATATLIRMLLANYNKSLPAGKRIKIEDTQGFIERHRGMLGWRESRVMG